MWNKDNDHPNILGYVDNYSEEDDSSEDGTCHNKGGSADKKPKVEEEDEEIDKRQPGAATVDSGEATWAGQHTTSADQPPTAMTQNTQPSRVRALRVEEWGLWSVKEDGEREGGGSG